jgi:hypothetical protein
LKNYPNDKTFNLSRGDLMENILFMVDTKIRYKLNDFEYKVDIIDRDRMLVFVLIGEETIPLRLEDVVFVR